VERLNFDLEKRLEREARERIELENELSINERDWAAKVWERREMFRNDNSLLYIIELITP